MNIQEWEDRKAKLPGKVSRKDFVKTHYYKNGKLIATLHPNGNIECPDPVSITQDTALIDEEFLNSFTKIKEEIVDELGFTHERTLAQSKQQAFDNEFRAAVMKELGIKPDHPKLHRLWEMAMDNTCGEGLQALYNEVSELSELLS